MNAYAKVSDWLLVYPASVVGIGSSATSESHEREITYLRRKWGRWLDVVQAKGTTRLVTRVQR